MADGVKKNYDPKTENNFINVKGVRLWMPLFSAIEPSLISTKVPIAKIEDISEIEPPSYFPTYLSISDDQRGVYWKFLSNPYNPEYNIGYVFILYYGLERHLFNGSFDDAFNVILKLRDVHSNSSFQNYSACALIISCILKQRADMAFKFFDSLDKEFELNFSSELYLLCKYSFDKPLYPGDLMRLSKTFLFKNTNYIKNYPSLFKETLTDVMKEKNGEEQILIGSYFVKDDFKFMQVEEISPFANLSIREQKIQIPMISSNIKLKKVVYELLESTHEEVKKKLAILRKTETVPKVESASKTNKVILSFDSKVEGELLDKYNNAIDDLDKHFTLIELQNFYYKYRKLDEAYLKQCIAYCEEDLNMLSQIQESHFERGKASLLQFPEYYNGVRLQSELNKIGNFEGRIPAFERLAIIYEKSGYMQKAISICESAVDYYSSLKMIEYANQFKERLLKLTKKMSSN